MAPLVSGVRKTLFLYKKIDFVKDLQTMVERDLMFFKLVVKKNAVHNSSWLSQQIQKYQQNIAEPNYAKFLDFVFDIIELDWNQNEIVSACQNYIHFMQHHDLHEHPSTKVDFVWHAHLQNRQRYEADVFAWTGKVIQHVP